MVGVLFRDFEWQRDPACGFHLVPAAKTPNPLFGKNPRGSTPARLSGFVDTKSGRPVARREGLEDLPYKHEFTERPARIERGGGPLEPYLPLRIHPGDFLLRQFVRIETEQSVLEFVNKFGPLTSLGLETGENTADTIEFARKARALFNLNQSTDKAGFRRELGTGFAMGHAIGAMLIPERSKPGVRLQITAGHLRDVLWFQLAEALTGRSTLRECQYCHEWFEAGPGKGRRFDASFCTPKHKEQHFNDLRRKDR